MLIECPYCHCHSEVPVGLVEGQHVKCAFCRQKFSYDPSPDRLGTVELDVGDRIGSYRVVRCIGSGGMGAVYEVEDVMLGKHFALKVFNLSRESSHARLLRQKFEEEAKQLAALNHPNIARVVCLGVDEVRGFPYFVMDLVTYVGGEPCTLADIESSKINEDLLAQWFSEMCRVLDYIHAQGIVHRDIKLENVLLNSDQHVVLTDFGVSKVFEGRIRKAVEVGWRTGDLSDEDMIFGTPHYIAPEIERGEPAAASSDVYSLGVMFFRLLTGEWYDDQKSGFSALSNRKYKWMQVLMLLLAPVERRPTCLAEVSKRLFQNVNWRARRAGTWRIELSDKTSKSKLRAAIAQAKKYQAVKERRHRIVTYSCWAAMAVVVSLGVGPLSRFARNKFEAYERERANELAADEAARLQAEEMSAAEKRKEDGRRKLVEEAFGRHREWDDVCSRVKDLFGDEVRLVRRHIQELRDDVRLGSYVADDATTASLCRSCQDIESRISRFEKEERAFRGLERLRQDCEDAIGALKGNEAVKRYALELIRPAEEAFRQGLAAYDGKEYVKARELFASAAKLIAEATNEAVRREDREKKNQESSRQLAEKERDDMATWADRMLPSLRSSKDFTSARSECRRRREQVRTPREHKEYAAIVAPLNLVDDALGCMEGLSLHLRAMGGRTIKIRRVVCRISWSRNILKAESVSGRTEWQYDWWNEIVRNQSGILETLVRDLVDESSPQAARHYLGAALLMKTFHADEEAKGNRSFFGRCLRVAAQDPSLAPVLLTVKP